jgi:hypothetical protein
MAYKGHALKIGSNWIGGILSQAYTSEAQMQVEPVAGSAYPQQTSIQGIKAGFRFTSYNVRAALNVLGFLGISLASNTAELYEILYNDDGLIAPGSVHRRVAMAAGRAIWRRISCSNQADAQIEIEVFGLSSNGLLSPVVYTEAVALPATVDTDRHTLFTSQLANIAMGCVLDLSIDSGLSISSAPCNSNVWDTRMDLRSIVPKISITTLNSELVGSGAGKIDLTGAAATHANTFIRLRKRIAKTGTFVANATLEHISVTADGIVMPTNPFSSSGNADGTTTYELTGTFDGTNLPLVINASAALP